MLEELIGNTVLPDFLWEPQQYKEAGLRVSLRVRRQLAGKKLLCHCPVRPTSRDYDVEVARHLRAAPIWPQNPEILVERGCSRQVVYRLSRDTSCTYELDDAPPQWVNDHALADVAGLVTAMGCVKPQQADVMRTQVLDGSMPSGFVRSLLAGWDCELPFLNNKLKIQRVTLLEDSARLVDTTHSQRVFMTDRLGVPLVEITTAATLTSPGDVVAAARLLRLVTGALDMAAHGQGAVRFDVGISTGQGPAVEIRGISREKDLAPVVHHEVQRQLAITTLAAELMDRGIDWHRQTQKDVSAVAKGLKKHRNHRVIAVLLPGFRGIMRQKTGQHEVIDEFVEYVARTVCIQHDMILCSEGEESFALSGVFSRVARLVQARRSDVIFLVIGGPETVKRAVKSLLYRAGQTKTGVLPEVRRMIKGDTEFLQPLLDYEMFPETDLPPVALTVGRTVPDMPWKVFEELRGRGITKDQANALITHRNYRWFYELLNLGMPAKVAAKFIIRFRKHPRVAVDILKGHWPQITNIKALTALIQREIRHE